LQAILTLDAFNNHTGKAGSDGIPDFINESFQYLADQAKYALWKLCSSKQNIIMKEHILKNVNFFLHNKYETQNVNQWQPHTKPTVKILVIACNTATAYAIADIKQFIASTKEQIQVIGVIDAGVKAALEYQQAIQKEQLEFLQRQVLWQVMDM
jgi:glutamate racemase